MQVQSTLQTPPWNARGIVVVRLLGDGIDVLGAVRNHTAVIGETVHDRVVGDSVIKAVLRSLRGYQLQGYHGDHQ